MSISLTERAAAAAKDIAAAVVEDKVQCGDVNATGEPATVSRCDATTDLGSRDMIPSPKSRVKMG